MLCSLCSMSIANRTILNLIFHLNCIFIGENLSVPSENMSWWKRFEAKIKKTNSRV